VAAAPKPFAAKITVRSPGQKELIENAFHAAVDELKARGLET